ncbi:hypothetical protein D3C79_865330 [compost metagenome]
MLSELCQSMLLKKQILVTQVYQWEQRQWLIRFGQNNYAIIQQIQNGLTVIVLYFQQVMARCYCTVYFI